jgi:hypothetical protein
MKPPTHALAIILTYSGTLPLIACAVLSFLPQPEIDVMMFARTYSAIIVSFLCGIHWAVYLFFAEKCSRNLLITSNLVALIVWLLLLSTNSLLTTMLQIVCFLYLLTLDLRLHNAGLLPEWFYRLRRNATVIVVLCLCMLMLNLHNMH